jgi:deoxyribodipyrimidine photo-lyase
MVQGALLHPLTNCLALVNYHCVIDGFEFFAVQPVLLWFRRNLRLSDNAAFIAAAESGCPVIPIYILDDQDVGGASRWWLHHSLMSLDRDLRQMGSSLVLRSGAPDAVLTEIAEQVGATALYYTRRYEPVSRRQEDEVQTALSEAVGVHVFDDSYLHNPETVATLTGSPYRVFTPFWRAANAIGDPPVPLPVPESISFARHSLVSLRLEELNLLPSAPDWAQGLRDTWAPGESGALDRIDELESVVQNYDQHRDRPDLDATSRLSPHLHFGEVSVRQVWHATNQLSIRLRNGSGGNALLRQLYWRDFSTYLIFHSPTLPDRPLRTEFEDFRWSENNAQLRAWQRGVTGYPIVDAGMRQLRQTGWMHNRVRMIAASFLVKDLLISWQAGAAWFLDNLVDADLANNSASWQWVAGCGTDAAPYFRVFNPTLQASKFDPHSHYAHRWIPELTDGAQSDYPTPIVDHGMARRRALEAYQAIKGMRTSKLAP